MKEAKGKKHFTCSGTEIKITSNFSNHASKRVEQSTNSVEGKPPYPVKLPVKVKDK